MDNITVEIKPTSPISEIANTMEPTNKTIKKENIITAIVLSLAFSFNIFVFAPLDSYYAGKSDFWFGVNTLLMTVSICFALSVLICLAVSLFTPRKVKPIIFSLMLSSLIALYVQGNFLMKGYPVLDGTAIKWDTMIQKGVINTIIWVVIFVLPMLIMIFKRNVFNILCKAVPVIIMGLQIVTLVTVISTSPNTTPKCYLSNENMFNLSKKQNIMVVLSDSFESVYMREALKEKPTIKEDLKDFTYYENTTGVSVYTYLGMASFLSGENFPVGEGALKGIHKNIEKATIYDSLHKNNYDVNLFSESTYVKPEFSNKIDNVKSQTPKTDKKANFAISKLIYKYTFYRYAPHFAKKEFEFNTSRFGATLNLSTDAYAIDDLAFNKKLTTNGITTQNEKNNFSFYHLNGPHPPETIDRNLKPVTYKKEVPNKIRRYEQAVGQIKLLNNLIAEMKKSGTYDNTTIIFMADHGYINRYDTVFMVKPANENSPFKISNAPISLTSDYVPFIEDLANNKGKDSALYQIPENSQRERNVSYYMSSKSSVPNVLTECEMIFAVNGKADDYDSYKIVKNKFVPAGKPEKKYKLGTSIDFIETADNARIYGILDANKAAYAKDAIVELDFENQVSTDMTAKIRIEQVEDENQTMIIKANGKELFNKPVPLNSTEVEFVIPKDCVVNNSVKLELEFPNFIRLNPTEENRAYYTRCFSFIFKDIKIS